MIKIFYNTFQSIEGHGYLIRYSYSTNGIIHTKEMMSKSIKDILYVRIKRLEPDFKLVKLIELPYGSMVSPAYCALIGKIPTII